MLLEPTHEDGWTLDLILTHKRFQNKLQMHAIIPSSTNSDHFLVLFDADLTPKQDEKVTFSNYRRFKDIDLEEFKCDLMSSELQNFSKDMLVDEAFNLYNSVLTQLMDKHYPILRRRLKRRQLLGLT